jgi:hypothetical protein
VEGTGSTESVSITANEDEKNVAAMGKGLQNEGEMPYSQCKARSAKWLLER